MMKPVAMTSSKNSSEPDSTGPIDLQRDSGDESEDEEVLEESPCGRWQKRREEVKQRDVPGIDCAFLAMDTEEGVEVVWNEVRISEKKSTKSQLDKIKQVFDNLIQLEHANIVKFHKYWTDTKTDKPRVIFITEYMSSGSLRQFLKKTKMNNKTLKAWNRWCTQILSALSYLHSCDPPIIHGNLTTDTIFIQHNGLIKIGSVAPDAIYSHVKTYKEEAKNMHYIAPEYAGHDPMTTAVDIYSFGICALEMAALEIHGNGDSGNHVSEECIQKTLASVQDPKQQDFILKCLTKDPLVRPKARDLLFHAVLFEVHSLKLLAAHCLVSNSRTLNDDAYPSTDAKTVVANIVQQGELKGIKVGDVKTIEVEKLLEDVRNGVYPLTAFALTHVPPGRPRAVSPELAESVKSETPEPVDTETRNVITMNCTIKKVEENPGLTSLTILLRMDDKMYRQLTCEVSLEDSPRDLADELVHLGFINAADREKLEGLIEDNLQIHSGSLSPHDCSPQLIEQRA